MVECYNCGYEIDEDDVEYECPFCEITDWDEGFLRCENCGFLMTPEGDIWECENCQNEGIKRSPPIDYYDDEDCYEDDEYCEDCIPDVNQGWVGEHYGKR